MKTYSKRMGFKLNVKDKWLYTYWWDCDEVNDLPYDLRDTIIKFIKYFEGKEVKIKVETRENKDE